MVCSVSVQRLPIKRPFRSWRFLVALPLCAVFVFASGTTAFALQAGAPPAVANSAASNPAPLADTIGPLRAALTEVGAALNQVRIDRWKVSRAWKDQFSNDASSIQQDLANRLPGLFQAAEQAPGSLEPQMRLMHNVDALYDVMVRVTTAANISGGRMDASVLDSALQNLESARKASVAQMLQTATQQRQKIEELQVQLRAARAAAPNTAVVGKTIIVNNEEIHHHHRRHPVHHRKPPAKNKPPAKSDKTAAAGSHSSTAQ